MKPAASRRQFLRVAIAAATTGIAGCTQEPGMPGGRQDSPTASSSAGTGTPASATDTPEPTLSTTPPDAVSVEPVASGFSALVDVVFAPGADRRYVVEQGGRILVHESEGVRDEPFLDLGDAVTVGGERGLLGFALHPAFASNRTCYVRYSAPARPGTPTTYSHTFVLSEFTATDDGLRAERTSERATLEIPQPQGNHNAGDLTFGPDGYCYLGVGDGGAAGDQGRGHVEDWYDGVGGGNGQDVETNLLGSILRIDVDGREDGKPYAVPDANPLVGEAGLDEHYAWGLRNPWRMSIDGEGSRVANGPDLYVGDVGQNRYEEVDLVRPGGNYGWNVTEGRHCYDASDCPGRTDDGQRLLEPIVEYPHSGAPVSGVSVIGGYVYRGDAIPGLVGRYVFADWQADGRLFLAEPGDEGGWDASVLDVEGSSAVGQVRSFGRDADGELYVVASGNSGWGVHRLTPA